MAIENRNLQAGEILVATYKKAEHRVLVVGDEETGLGFELNNGTIYKSLSSAGSAVMGGTACNGWRFWTRESEVMEKAEAKAAEKPETEPKAKRSAKSKVVTVVRRMKVQTGAPEGQVKYFCSSCQKPFFVEKDAEVSACPEGHASEQVDDLAPAAQTEPVAS